MKSISVVGFAPLKPAELIVLKIGTRSGFMSS